MTMNTHTTLPVLVAGGGIGGLAAALALVRQGFRVQVFEQAAEIGEIGDGVLGHYAPTLFLRFIEATSSTAGCWPACGCSVPL